jgi:UDP-glucuronate decarboxylase
VYGDPETHPQTEDYVGHVSVTGIRACYDEGKRCAETLFYDYYRQHQLDIRVVRIFNTYGPYMHTSDGRVVSNFIVQALKDENITIYGDGSQTRSFQYIDDLIEGFVRMMNNDKDFIGPVNMGNPDEFTIKELAEKIIELIPNTKSKIVYKDLPQDDPKRRKPDITLAKEKLDWQPKIKLEKGLKKTIKYFESVL